MSRRIVLLAVLVVLSPLNGHAAATSAKPAVSTEALGSYEGLIASTRSAMMVDPELALKRAEQAQALAERQPRSPPIQWQIAQAQWLSSEALIRLHQPQRAFEIADKAIKGLSIAHPKSALMGSLLRARGGARSKVGDVAGALVDYQAAYALFSELNDNQSMAKTLIDIGTVYFEARNYSKSLTYIDQAINLIKYDTYSLISLLNNKADSLIGLMKYADAIKEYNRALEISRTGHYYYLYAQISINLANANILNKRIAEAKKIIEKDKILINLKNDPAIAKSINATEARIQFESGNIDKAKLEIGKIFDNNQFKNEESYVRDFHQIAYQIFSAAKDYKRAYEHLAAFKRLDDASRDIAANANTALTAAQFDFAKQDLRITKLQASQLQKDVALAKSHDALNLALFIGAAVLAALLGSSLMTILVSHRRVKGINAKLNLANQRLERALKAKTEFLATTSHEIRTPLNGILGMTQVLLADSSITGPTREKIGVVHHSGETMLSLVNDILDVAKMESDHLEIHKAPMDLHRLLRKTTELWQSKAALKGLNFNLHLGETPALILEDADRLRQILFNLLSNAIKFTDAGDVSLSADILQEANRERLILCVRDSGVGIPADKLETVFDAFTQLDSSLQRRHAGTGLGLTISRKLTEALGGDLSVESTLGEGSAFSVSLPLSRAGQPDDALDRQGESQAGDSRVTVLLVEASPLTQSLIRSLLANKVRALEIVPVSEAALPILAERPFDIILAEHSSLTHQDREAISQLRAMAPESRLLVMQASPSDDQVASHLAAGADAVLAKPFAAKTLIDVILGDNQSIKTARDKDIPMAKSA